MCNETLDKCRHAVADRRLGQALRRDPTEASSEFAMLGRAVVEKDLKASIERSIDTLGDEIEQIEDLIATLITASETMRERQDLLESIPCIAATTSATIIAELPELGQRSTSVLKALVGVAPFNADSGAHRGERHIQGGRAALRQAHKQAIVACIGKLVSIMNAIIKTETAFKNNVTTA